MPLAYDFHARGVSVATGGEGGRISLEMHQIRYFLAVAETLNFTRAAETCNVTQPALTRAVQKLEEEHGGLLFRRERNHTHLTDLGRLMRQHLEHVLSQAAAAQTTAKSFLKLDDAPLNLGVMCTIGQAKFVGFLTAFRARQPGIEINVVEGVPARLAELLGEGAIDVAVMASPAPLGERFQAQPLFRERFMVGLPIGHALARKNMIALAELDGESYLARMNCEMRDHIRAERERRGIAIRYCFRSERDDWIQSMVAAGLGICIMPESLPVQPGVTSRPIFDPEIIREVMLVYIAGRRFSPAVSAFIRAIREYRWES